MSQHRTPIYRSQSITSTMNLGITCRENLFVNKRGWKSIRSSTRMIRAPVAASAGEWCDASILGHDEAEVGGERSIGVIGVDDWLSRWGVACHILVQHGEDGFRCAFIVCKDGGGAKEATFFT